MHVTGIVLAVESNALRSFYGNNRTSQGGAEGGVHISALRRLYGWIMLGLDVTSRYIPLLMKQDIQYTAC